MNGDERQEQGVSAGAGGKGFLTFAVTARGAIVLWLAYVAANALVRYSFTHTLSNDDVSASLLVQTFELGYGARNPPLWEWLLWTLQQAVGPGYESHWLLRYGCIALFGIAIFRVARLASGDVRWSAVVMLSSPLFYQIGWPFLEWGTQTLILIVILLFSLEVVIRYAIAPSASLAVLLGALFGLGLLSKFGYGIFAVAVTLALLAHDTRSAVFRRESLLVPLVAVVVLSPFIYWLVDNHADPLTTAHSVLVGQDRPHASRVLYGMGKLAENCMEFLMPFALIAVIAVWQARRSGMRAAAGAGAGERILRRVFLFSLAIAILGIVAIGPTSFSSGYAVPILVAAVPYSACLLSRHVPDAASAERFAALSISVLVVIVLVRLLFLSNSGFPETNYRREMWPIAGLAEEMRAAGLDSGTLVVVGRRDGGNIRMELPGLRIVTVGEDDEARAPAGPEQAGPCRLLWNDTGSIAPGQRWARTGDGRIAETLPQVANREPMHFDIPWAPSLLGNARTSRWTVVELDPDDPLCR